MKDYEALQKQTDKDIELHTQAFASLYEELEALVAIGLKEYMDTGDSNPSKMIRQAQAKIAKYERNTSYANVGKEELDELHKQREARFADNNIKQHVDVPDRENYIADVKQQAQEALSSAPADMLQTYTAGVQVYNEIPLPEDVEDFQEYAEKQGYDNVSSMFVEEDGVTYLKRKGGSKMRAEYWLNQQMRTAFAKESTQSVLDDMLAYDYDLIRTSAHNDCSKFCAPYQGRIYSQSGKSKKYPYFKDILMFGGTGKGSYKHWNCRHHESIYIPGASDNALYDKITKLPKETINKNYERRQQGMYYRRLANFWADRWRKAKEMGRPKEELDKYKRKRAYYNALKLKYGVN